MPGSAKGVLFITLKDESAIANLIVWPPVFKRFRRAILSGSMFGVRGRMQHASNVIHLIVEEAARLTTGLKAVAGLHSSFPLPGRCRETRGKSRPQAIHAQNSNCIQPSAGGLPDASTYRCGCKKILSRRTLCRPVAGKIASIPVSKGLGRQTSTANPELFETFSLKRALIDA
jgi:hypothetical protein